MTLKILHLYLKLYQNTYVLRKSIVAPILDFIIILRHALLKVCRVENIYTHLCFRWDHKNRYLDVQ